MEKWVWEAHYTDGTILKQYDTVYHYFHEIDQSKLNSFWLVSSAHPPIVLDWMPGRELILFTLNTIQFFANKKETTRIYCVGYKEKDYQKVVVIMPDNSIFFTDDIYHLNLEELIQ